MKDLKYSPTSFDVKKGDTVTFAFRNDDAIPHDAFIGDEAAQDDHEAGMRSASTASDMSETSETSGMDHGGGAESEAIVVQPGKTGELTHTFDTAGTLLIGCHEVGHYAGGMKATISVT
ncbi:MAG: cupredoxin domain-containing protein [Acidimicrobiales bacterium]